MSTPSPASFKDAMRRLAATVTIITTRRDGERRGITATAVTSLCMDPPSLLVCVNKSSSLHSLLMDSRRFCVNLLRSEDAGLADAFSGRLSQDERFDHGDWMEDESGLPFLAQSQASVFCEKRQITEYGSHTIFIGEATSVMLAEKICPLLYSDGAYRRCAPLAMA